jgi:hypothetical protein
MTDIDMFSAAVSSIDTSGTKMLGDLKTSLDKRSVQLALANPGGGQLGGAPAHRRRVGLPDRRRRVRLRVEQLQDRYRSAGCCLSC